MIVAFTQLFGSPVGFIVQIKNGKRFPKLASRTIRKGRYTKGDDTLSDSGNLGRHDSAPPRPEYVRSGRIADL